MANIPLIPQKVDISEPTHICVKRNDDEGVLNSIKAWYLFVLHAVTACLFAAVMLYYVNDRHFRTGAPPNWFRDRASLYQTDAVALISSALVLIKLIASAALALLVWRLIFFLLDKDGLSLEEVCRLDGYRFPILSLRRWSWITIPVFLLAWPSQFISPLATGAVAWQPVTVTSNITNYTTVSVAGPGDGWNGINWFPENRRQAIIRAAALAGSDAPVAAIMNRSSLYMRRSFTTSADLSAKSSLFNIRLPYFGMDPIEWVDFDTVNSNLMDGISDSSGILNISISTSPISATWIGNAALLRNTSWHRSNAMNGDALAFPAPPSIVAKDEAYLAVMVNRLLVTDDVPDPNCTTAFSPIFGTLPTVKQYNLTYYSGGAVFAKNCYIIGRTSIEAGVHNCVSDDNCVVASSGLANNIATLSMDKPLSNSTHRILDPDPLRDSVIAFMPEVILNVSEMNITSLPMWESLESYITELFTLSYQSTWSTLTEVCQSNTDDSMQIVTIHPPIYLISANVSKTKILAWLGCNLALLLSGIIVYIAQHCTSSKTIRNTTLAALTMDLSDLVDYKGGCGLCNAVELSREDKKMGRMKWIQDEKRPWHRAVELYSEVKEI